MRPSMMQLLFLATVSGFCITAALSVETGDDKVFRVGAVLESTDIVLEIALRRAIEVANGVLNRTRNLYGYRLVPDIRRISTSDGFNASLEACSLLETGVVAIIGPTSGQASEQVRSVCEYFAVPHIETNWNYRVPRLAHYTVNLSPHFETYSKALGDYIQTMVPTSRTAIIYDDPDSLLKFEGLLNSVDAPVLVRQWAQRSGTYKYVMKELRAARISRFLVDIPLTKLVRFMIIAKEMNMTSEYNSYIFTAWDVNRVDLSDFQIIRGSNFSTLTLLPTLPPGGKYSRGPIVEQMRREIHKAEQDKRDYSSLLTDMLPTAAATLFDSIVLLASGLNLLTRAQVVRPQRLSCSAPRQEMWTAGPSLLNFMRSVRRRLVVDAGG